VVGVTARVRIRIALGAVLCLATTAGALTVRALSLDDLLARAERVVHAQCVAVTPVAARDDLPAVEITLAVTETLKGAPDERLVIRQVAGRLAGVVPTCRAGDEVVLFLHAPSRAGLTSPVGLGQGYLQVVRTAGRPARVVGDARIVGALAPQAATSGSASTLGAAAARQDAVPLDTALETLRLRLGVAR
jgi:hypothetical protein